MLSNTPLVPQCIKWRTDRYYWFQCHGASLASDLEWSLDDFNFFSKFFVKKLKSSRLKEFLPFFFFLSLVGSTRAYDHWRCAVGHDTQPQSKSSYQVIKNRASSGGRWAGPEVWSKGSEAIHGWKNCLLNWLAIGLMVPILLSAKKLLKSSRIAAGYQDRQQVYTRN